MSAVIGLSPIILIGLFMWALKARDEQRDGDAHPYLGTLPRRINIIVTRRIIGCGVIVSAILIRVFVLDAYWFLLGIDLDLMMVLWSLAPVGLAASMMTFLILWLLKKINPAEQMFDFLCSVVGWLFGGIGIAAVIIIAISAYYHSAQGPFALIFLDGPLGAGVGMFVGLFMWLLNVRDNLSSETMAS